MRGKLAGIISNPPYIPSDHISGLQAEVGKHEPIIALDGGTDGMSYLLHLCRMSASMLRPGGYFAFEVTLLSSSVVKFQVLWLSALLKYCAFNELCVLNMNSIMSFLGHISCLIISIHGFVCFCRQTVRSNVDI